MAETSTSELWAPFTKETSAASTETISRTPNSTMDKDMFLKLLIAQMKYQDPLNPTDDKQFMAQLAQFTSLEQMQNMNTSMSKSQAYSMIGRTVYSYNRDANTGLYTELMGTVLSVTTKNGEVYVNIEGTDVPLSDVEIVGTDYVTSNQMSAINDNIANTRDMSLIGRHIQAITVDSKGNATGFVEGKVDYVKFNGSQSVLMVGNQEVYPTEVVSVSDGMMLTGQTVNARIQNEKGTYSTIENAVIKGVTIENNKAYLNVEVKVKKEVKDDVKDATDATANDEETAISNIDDDDTAISDEYEIKSYKVLLEKINYIIEALQYVGQPVQFDYHDGVVKSITMRNGIPYFDINDGQLSYTEFKKIVNEEDVK